MRQEIAEQPQVIAETLRLEGEKIAAVAEALRGSDTRLIIIVARGTSDNAATYARYLFECVNGCPVELGAPSVLTVYQARLNLEQTCVLGISQSGEASDVIHCLTHAAQMGGMTCALTNVEDSPLCEAAQHTLLTHARREESVPATKTYTTALAVLHDLSARWAGVSEQRACLQEALGALPQVFDQEPRLEDRGERFRYMERCVVLARGLNYCTAKEVALKLTETCYVVAEAWSTADFMHGPIAAVDEEVPAFIFAPRGPTLPSMLEATRALKERGAERIVFSDAEELLDLATVGVPMPRDLEECCSPIVYVVAGQLLAYHLSRHKGIDPDRPRGLSKVTSTTTPFCYGLSRRLA